MYIIVNQQKISIYKNLYTVYNIILDYIDIIINWDNKLNYLDNLKIYYLKKNIIIDIYTLDKEFNLINSNNDIVNINNNILNSYRLKLLNSFRISPKVNYNKIINKEIIQESEINMFLPINENYCISESYEDINTNIYIKPKNINKEEILDLINHLKNKIENEKIKLKDINKKYENKLDSYLESKHKLGLLEMKEKKKLEKEEENRKVFKVDKKIYNIFKQEINDNVRDPDDIPEIFINKFLIFKKLDELNINKEKQIDSAILNELNESPSYSEEYYEFKKLKNILNINFNISSTFDNMFDDNNNIYNKLSNNFNWELEIDSQTDSSEEYSCSSIDIEVNDDI